MYVTLFAVHNIYGLSSKDDEIIIYFFTVRSLEHIEQISPNDGVSGRSFTCEDVIWSYNCEPKTREKNNQS